MVVEPGGRKGGKEKKRGREKEEERGGGKGWQGYVHVCVCTFFLGTPSAI